MHRGAAKKYKNTGMRQIHWDMLADTEGTIWEKAGGGLGQFDVVFADLKTEFSTKKAKVVVNTGAKKKKVEANIILDPKRRHNMAIFVKTINLKGRKTTMDAVGKCFQDLDANALGKTTIAAVAAKFMPTGAEIDAANAFVSAHGGKLALKNSRLLGPAERFVLGCAGVTRLEERVKYLQFQETFALLADDTGRHVFELMHAASPSTGDPSVRG